MFFEKNVVVFVFFRKIHFVVVSFIVETVETAELPIFVGKNESVFEEGSLKIVFDVLKSVRIIAPETRWLEDKPFLLGRFIFRCFCYPFQGREGICLPPPPQISTTLFRF